MCNLYSMTSNREAVLRLFRVSDNRAAAWEPRQAIFPGYTAPVVRKAEDGEREISVMNWGFVLRREDYAPKRVTNIRDDKALSRFWKNAVERRRCLVPASSYCEPDSNSPARWHWFALKDAAEARPIFAFPGAWMRYKGPVKKNGPDVEQDVYAFLTCAPNELTSTIMHDRMPMILSGEAEFEAWLSGSTDEAMGLVRSYPAERMRIVQSGFEKKDLLAA